MMTLSKNIVIRWSVLIFAIALLSCKQKKSDSIILNKTDTNKSESAYFDFDEVDHYHSDIEERKVYLLNNPHSKIKKAEGDDKRAVIYMEDVPDELPDENYGKQLEEFGFKKKRIDPSRNKEISNIFSLTTCNDVYAAACVPIYRDIFIFKKEGRIIGLAKICFNCRLYYIVGTDKDQGEFGQCGGYEKLFRLIEQ
ncbi:hypothetical protein [Flavobacterium cerinum]|uniref:Uncharacterized protein n=1 Tax=Flavobacterium cerinum TaxID=2502784 RepID=A0ABY5ISD9_9FLAO|nr:hypothetical protein [Flavobacterium cerinum]UUC44688.1 hypothetical protein NOX80_13740 [Flavobacterium cerinum]